jgi:hypothetical protein
VLAFAGNQRHEMQRQRRLKTLIAHRQPQLLLHGLIHYAARQDKAEAAVENLDQAADDWPLTVDCRQSHLSVKYRCLPSDPVFSLTLWLALWRSPRRPSEIAAAEQVQVQVRHGLTGTLLAIDYQPIPVADAKFLCQLGGHHVQMTEQLTVFRLDVGVGGNDLARDDEHVYGRLRIDVVEGDAVFVLVDDAGGDFLFDNLQENVVAEHVAAP